MLDYETFVDIARRIDNRSLGTDQAYHWSLTHVDVARLGEMNKVILAEGHPAARAMFYRVLYRFHRPHPDVRSEYVQVLNATDDMRDRLLVIRAADWIDVGNYEEAFQLLLGGLATTDDRWSKSVLFQLVRLGWRSSRHTERCLEPAVRLRELLEEEFAGQGQNDRITKYTVTSLFVTWQWIRKMKPPAVSGWVREVAGKMEADIERVLARSENWDAC